MKDFSKYKLNGVSFYTENSIPRCSIQQCGVTANYPFLPCRYVAPAKYVMMDLDGTSVQSEEFWIWLIEKTAKNPKFTLSAEDIPFVSGFSTIEPLEYCIKKYEIQTTSIEANRVYHEIAEYELNEIMQGRGNVSAFRPRVGLKEFLLELKARDIKVGLATSGLDYKAIPEIVSAFRVLGLGDPTEFYDGIITGGKRKIKGGYGTLGEMAVKPHPWVYAELALGLGVTDKSQAIVLEDSSAGLISGRLAGFDVIGFNDGNIIKSGMAEETYAMVDSLSDILYLL